MKKILATIMLMSCCASYAQDSLPMDEGKFIPTDSSLEQYEYPEWFVDAKFGIWAVWGPMSVPRQGDWYARNMYIQDVFDNKTKKMTGVPNPDYTYHLEHYGHPSKVGFKDIIPLWKAENFDADKLMKIYKKAGAKYFATIATHHDNFFLWNSNLHRWTSSKMGPMRDIVGEFKAAAKKQNLKFGVTEHLGASYFWYQPAHSADATGQYAGVPYDANDPAYADLYHEKAKPEDVHWLTPNKKFQRRWFDCIKELVDMYEPDLLYSDSWLPFGDVGRTLVAHYYNQSLERTGVQDVVYTCKEQSKGRFVHDYELGIATDIQPLPWQTDSSVGEWVYNENDHYRSAQDIIYMLIDIVSKNGNLLLNVALTPEGEIDAEQMEILKNIGKWLKTNGEAIYASRPWNVYGEGPSMTKTHEKGEFSGIKPIEEFEAGDLRFTRSKAGDKLYVFVMQNPEGDITIESLTADNKVKSVKQLGGKRRVKFEQATDGKLIIKEPKMIANSPVTVYEVRL